MVNSGHQGAGPAQANPITRHGRQIPKLPTRVRFRLARFPPRSLARPDTVASSGMSDVQQIQVSRIIEAPVERVFALLADPDRHPDLDGTGMLRASRTHTVITEVGDVLIMDLNTEDHGIHQAQNVVTTYVRDRALGWSPGLVDGDPFGDTFTFTLEPDSDDRTLVTLSYDWSAVTDEQLLAMMPRASREDLTRSLDRLAAAL
jgi:uncharacterized protein YndB with AHSA1/START domain